MKAEGEKELTNNGDSEDQEQKYALKCHNKIPQEAFKTWRRRSRTTKVCSKMS